MQIIHYRLFHAEPEIADPPLEAYKRGEEEAMKLLNTRNETKDIKPVSGWVRTWVPETPNTKAEKELKFMEFEPKQHICKMLHNSGGKK